jgi:signal transduction histidine kinase
MALSPRRSDVQSPEVVAAIGHACEGRFAGERIVVIDDTAPNRLAIAAAFEALGCEVFAADSGPAGIELLRTYRAAVVFLDVQMPEIDGYETARRIRREGMDVPIIFLTAHDVERDQVKAAYRLGAVDFLQKPIDIEILRAKARVFLEIAVREREAMRAQQRAHERDLEAQRRVLEVEKLSAIVAELSSSNRQKDEMLAIVAHELRGPLAPMRTAIELAERGTVTPRLIDVLARQVRHMTRLVDDLMTAASLRAGKLTLSRQPTQIDEIVDAAVLACRALVDARGHALTVRRSTETLVVEGDPVRLIQCLTNLLTNAARYTPVGGAIELACEADASEIVVRVSDNGVGVPAAMIERIFDPFVQGRSTETAGGLGLGLALVKRLVGMHGGRITCASAGEGRGASFEIRLPRVMPRAGRKLRAVIIDDNEHLRAPMAQLLASAGHEIFTASEGRDGLRMVVEVRPDVALIDLRLPDLDGYAIAAAIRAHRELSTLRLIAMSSDGERTRALDAGFDVQLTRPASADAILAVLDSRIE